MASILYRGLKRARLTVKQLPARLGGERYCICCGWRSGRFLGMGDYDYNRREDAMCPWCYSVERHRLLLHFLRRHGDAYKAGTKLLHFAPERSLLRHFSKRKDIDYLTADLFYRAMVKEDITQLTFGDDSFDLILCSHVLDHVPDDQKGMRELYRVLRPDGMVLVLCLVDPNSAVTRDSPPSGAPKRDIGCNCIRLYGRDLRDRLASVGFEVEVVDEREQLTPEQKTLFGVGPKSNPHLLDQDTIYVCRKPR